MKFRIGALSAVFALALSAPAFAGGHHGSGGSGGQNGVKGSGNSTVNVKVGTAVNNTAVSGAVAFSYSKGGSKGGWQW